MRNPEVTVSDVLDVVAILSPWAGCPMSVGWKAEWVSKCWMLRTRGNPLPLPEIELLSRP